MSGEPMTLEPHQAPFCAVDRNGQRYTTAVAAVEGDWWRGAIILTPSVIRRLGDEQLLPLVEAHLPSATEEELPPTTPENIDDRIDEWHDGEYGDVQGIDLHTYLGWTWEQYRTWIRHGEFPQAGS